MKKVILVAAVLNLVFQFSNVLASEVKTITLAVDGMTCNMCPITVKRALKKLDGVSEVTAKYEGNDNGWAQVTFDSNKVNIDDITFATEEAGFPSRISN